MNAIELTGLCIARDGATVRDISLTVAAGESVALVGSDQVVLTLVVRACIGLEVPDAGTVVVRGVDVGVAGRRELLELRQHVGYVSVAGGAFSNMTALENIAVVLRYHAAHDEATIQARARELLLAIGLLDLADTRVSTLPSELHKCIAYARAMASDPELVLSEDPSAFLHPRGRSAVERLHAGLRASGTTVLVADDDIEFVSRLADRAVLLQDGRIQYDGPFAGLTETRSAHDVSHTRSE